MTLLRNSIFVTVLMALSSLACAAGSHRIEIPAGKLAEALQALARQTGVELIYQTDQVKGLLTKGVSGELDAEEAVRKLLAGTPLTARVDPSGAISIAVASNAAASRNSAADNRQGDDMRLVKADAANGTAAGSPESDTNNGRTEKAATDDRSSAQEIVVTAQKRKERLRDVPVPVTALSASALVDGNQLRLQDYYANVPGLNFSMDNRGSPYMAIRGVTTGAYVTPTVGITIDDMPFGSTVIVSSFSPAADIDPNELARIEVLRGPQGTLYGASSIGGLIKYVTMDPSTEGVAGRVQAGANTIAHGSGTGYSASGSINLPLGETFAVRASGFTREDPGYIDNVQTGRDDVNTIDVYGGRLSALWRPSDAFSLKLSALYQHGEADGSSQSRAGLGDLEQTFLGGIGGYERKIQAYSANATAKIGNAELTSITGYGRSVGSDSFDVSSALGPVGQIFYGVGGVAWIDEDNRTSKFSQELRLASPVGERAELLLGAFYTREHANPDGGYLLVDPVTYARATQIYRQQIDGVYKEYAAFAAVTFHITDRFDVQVGAREGRNDQTLSTATRGVPPIFGDAVQPASDSSDHSLTYLLTPRYRLTPNAIAYARFASGYRPGGPNYPAPNTPDSFAPDKTQNYELGLKGDFLDRRLSVDASVYYIDWRDIQLSLFEPTAGSYTGNGGKARSAGVELSIEARPIQGMTLSSWIVWNDAQLTESVPPNTAAYGVDGDRLPYSSRLSGNISLQQNFPLGNAMTGFVGARVAYVGDRIGEFISIFAGSLPIRQTYGSYARTDLRAGLKYDSWTLNVFLNNLTDRRGVLGGGLGTFPAFGFNYIQPRTLGLSVAKEF